jgi:Tfp pilus assembly PilM family ATPase
MRMNPPEQAHHGRRRHWFGRKHPDVAADFGRGSLRLLQLDHAATAYACTAAAEVAGCVLEGGTAPTSTPEDFGDRVRAACARVGFAGRDATITLPAECFQADIARLPAMNDVELAESIRFEATDRFGISADSASIGHLRLGSTTGGSNEVLMLAVANATVQRAAIAMARAGFRPSRVEHAALAALRAVSRQRTSECAEPADARDFAMIHLEDRVATLAVVRDGSLSFLRTVRGDWAPAGMTAARRATAIRLANDAIEIEPAAAESTAWRWCALAEEVLRCLRHFERTSGGWWPRAIAVTGPAANDPQSAATLESVCGARTSLCVPIRAIERPAPCIHGNTWIAAIGAACTGLGQLDRAPRADAEPAAPVRTAPRTSMTRAQATGTIALAPEPKPAALTATGGAAA